MTWARLSFSGFGRTSIGESDAARPESLDDLRHAVGLARKSPAAAGMLARGNGLSYGDAAVNHQGRMVLTERLNQFIDFDPNSGRLTAQAGVTIGDVVRCFLPRGWMIPVTPGTAFVTLGGALAADVHGKNHDRAGSFGNHVEWFDLLLADGSQQRVSPDNDPALFWATVGGMGLTGIVQSLCLRLERVQSSAIAVREQRAHDLDELMAQLAQARTQSSFSVAWIDALAKGRTLGRGIVESGDFAPAEAVTSAPPYRANRLALPCDLPSCAMSPPLVAAFNSLYWRRIPALGRNRLLDASRFLYPLDAIQDWNRLYGKTGFYQFQCVLPDHRAAAGLPRLLETAAASSRASFLAVLKTLGEQGSGMMSFPRRGWTLAMDFPVRPGIAELLHQLERITLEHEGRLYLAKDALMQASSLPAMYPRLDEFRAVLDRIDPTAFWQSNQSRRLGIRPDTQGAR